MTTNLALVPALAREADFQAAWYLGMLIFAIVVFVVGGTVVTERTAAGMWRNGDRSLALITAAVATTTIVFFAFLFSVTVTGLWTRAFGG